MLGSYGLNTLNEGAAAAEAGSNGANGNGKLTLVEWVLLIGGVITFQLIIEGVKPEMKRRGRKK